MEKIQNRKSLETVERERESYNLEKGITLIALIITIIILLILATITIDVAIDGKLFDTAKEAVDRTNDRVGEEQETIDELMNEWDKVQGGMENSGSSIPGGNNNTETGNNNTGGGIVIEDNTPPTVNVIIEGTTTNSIAISVTAEDNETGMIENPEYTYYIKESTANTYEALPASNNSSYTYTGLKQNTTYNIKVEVNGDEAGNVGTGENSATTSTVTSALEQGAITFTNPTWSGGKASITINTNTNYYIEYQLNGRTGTWIRIANGGRIENLSHGTTIYENPPTGTITINEITAESIKVTVNASDRESGLATSGTYAYYLNSEGTARATSTSNTYAYQNLAQNTNYTIKVVIRDQAGNEYEATTTGQTEKKGDTAVVVAQNPTVYYGKEVVNYGVTYDNTSGATNKWRIFYADEENIYLIADDYIHKDYAPKAGSYEIYVYDTYGLTTNYVYQNYTAGTDIEATLGNKWLSKYYPSYKSSANVNIRAVAYMLDTSIWNPIYKNEYAEYAIGGPTLEMFCESYKDTHSSRYIECTANSTGYEVRWQGGSYDYSISGVPKDEYNSIYIKPGFSKAYAMWLASPSAGYTDHLMTAYCDRLCDLQRL